MCDSMRIVSLCSSDLRVSVKPKNMPDLLTSCGKNVCVVSSRLAQVFGGEKIVRLAASVLWTYRFRISLKKIPVHKSFKKAPASPNLPPFPHLLFPLNLHS